MNILRRIGPRHHRRMNRQAIHDPHLAVHVLENPPRIPRGGVRRRMWADRTNRCRPDSTWTSTSTGAGTATRMATTCCCAILTHLWSTRAIPAISTPTRTPQSPHSPRNTCRRSPTAERTLPRCHHAAQPRRAGRGRRAADALPRSRSSCSDSPLIAQLAECIAIVVNMSYGKDRTARTLVCQIAGTSTQSGPRTAMQTTSSTRFASKESS